ncbi:MAG: alpha/beta hydrolase [Dermatophilaceae bacterium]
MIAVQIGGRTSGRLLGYRTHDVPVEGGALRVGEWAPEDPSAPTVIAVHGITASHMSWAMVAQALPEVRLVAVDLRGRGRSAGLPGPYGMARHAEDLEAVMEALQLTRAILVGHSMGGFVAVVAAHRHPDRFSKVLLVDGGLPLAVPAGIPEGDLLQATLGPAAQRLSMTFKDRPTYLDFWKKHPAFVGHWSQAVADYASYDLTGAEPTLRPSASFEAVKEDTIELFGAEPVLAALAGLTQPVTLLTAPRGLLNQTPGIYDKGEIERWKRELPGVELREVPDVNHYTIVMSAAGARAVADQVRSI